MTDIIDRLTNSEEYAIDEAIPQVAYDAVEELIRLRNIEHIVKKYLQECIEDYEDRWITRETLHNITKEKEDTCAR